MVPPHPPLVALPYVHLLVPSLIQMNCPYRVQTQEKSVQPWESKPTTMALTAASEPVVAPSPCYLLKLTPLHVWLHPPSAGGP